MKVHHAALGTALITIPMLAQAAPMRKAVRPFTIGSGNVAVIEPPVTVPAEKPCVVSLYKNAMFGANNADFNYTPAAACPGPWAAVVLSVDVSLDAGIQYDRTGTIWMAGVPLWFGTTAEPDPKLGPSWHFERNVTDYSALFTQAQTGYALIANYTNSEDTSIITSSAKLLFYPATTAFPAPRTPDMVIPLASAGGGTIALNTGTDVAAISQTLPPNIEAAVMDVYLQGQSGDEFWYTCVPDSFSTQLESCGGGSYREGEITVDGAPAGVAPVYPWIFTGGIDPYLWFPIPGVQTLDFKPFRVELSPFAGQLSSGGTHNIGLSLFGANQYFSVAGALMLYLDSGSTQVTGSVTQNTLVGTPVPVVTNTIKTSASGVVSGNLTTSSVRDFTISGTAVTSQGTVQYTVNQAGNFSNSQNFKISGNLYKQFITQSTGTTVSVATTTSAGTATQVTALNYPLNVDITEIVQTDGNISQATKIYQDSDVNVAGFTASGGETSATDHNSITTADTLIFDSGFNLIGHHGQASTANYKTDGSAVPCFERTLVAKSNKLISAVTGCGK